jgi:hypothetical protein
MQLYFYSLGEITVMAWKVTSNRASEIATDRGNNGKDTWPWIAYRMHHTFGMNTIANCWSTFSAPSEQLALNFRMQSAIGWFPFLLVDS